MFDRKIKVPVRLLRQAGDIRTVASFPTDEQILIRFAARRLVITDLGRGNDKIESLKPEADLELAKDLIEDKTADLQQREAEALMMRILSVEVVDCLRSVGGFDVAISHPVMEAPLIVTVKVPTADQLDEFEQQFAPRKTLNAKQQYIQPNHKISAKLWADLGPEIDIPINWKSVVFTAIKQKVDELSSDFSDPT